MLAADLISDNIPPIKPSDTGVKAMKWMDEFRVSHLPIVDGRKLLGIISDNDILDLESPDQPIEKFLGDFDLVSVTDDKHYYDVLKIIAEEHLSVIPVVDKDGNYIGSIAVNQMIEKLANVAAVNEPGSILILDVKPVDYSLSQIAQIVESNDAKVLSMYVSNNMTSGMDVTLKINKQEINGVIQTFQRYGYNIKSTFQINNYFQEDMKSRYEGLMNFLNL